MKDLFNLLGAILLVMFMLVLCWLLITFPYYLIWNWAIVPLTGIVKINFAQAMIMSLLVNIAYMCYAMVYDSEEVPDDRDI